MQELRHSEQLAYAQGVEGRHLQGVGSGAVACVHACSKSCTTTQHPACLFGEGAAGRVACEQQQPAVAAEGREPGGPSRKAAQQA
eukprot:3937094-Lingulodinium_polyedra.AAC.1